MLFLSSWRSIIDLGLTVDDFNDFFIFSDLSWELIFVGRNGGVCSFFKQQSDNFGVAKMSTVGQRSPSFVVSGIDISIESDNEFSNTLEVVVLTGETQEWAAMAIPDIDDSFFV